MAVLSVWLLLLAVSFAEARECYNSVSRIGERVPSLDITYCRSEYCVKFDDAMGMTRRTCDRGGLCNRIGTGCQFVRNYDLHAEAYACCCRGDLCNSAMPFSSTKASLVYGAVLISLIYGYFRV